MKKCLFGEFMKKSAYENICMTGFVLSLCVALDQTTKRVAEQILSGEPVHSFLFDTIRLHFIKNPGAFLGFGADYSSSIKFYLFILIPILFLIAAIIFLCLARDIKLSQRVMIALMVGGGIGNMIDRLIFDGRVTDFINMGIGPVRTGIFNIADVALMAGAIGLLFCGFKEKRVADKTA